MEKIKTNCSHPNCRLTATKSHPKEDKGLCDNHYTEITSSMKHTTKMVTLTHPSKA